MTNQLNQEELMKAIDNVRNKEYRDRLIRMATEMARGFDFMDNYDSDRVVTLYGSTMIKSNTTVYKKAVELTTRLAKEGIVVVTGGGPGMMEAANKGAFKAHGRSVGLNIFLNIKERRNNFTSENFSFNYFFARKLILAHIAQAYVYFPGGFGTMDEFFEMTTLMSTKKVDRKMPVILFGKSYWDSLIKWMRENPVKKYHTLTEEKLKLWTITDDVDEAFDILKKIPNKINRHKSL
ncbi:MAG: TIGR00730 family Rossman fold protein [Candidatus Buchananbacteria bacterium]|nr:TIGR00730 family Rossman fold protein [Candidatus Buchananbacteria bacterium]